VFAGATRLSRLKAGEQLLYTFDMGDDSTHLCTVAEQRIDPLEALGIIPAGPLACWGWARSPTSTVGAAKTTTARPLPPDPQFADLPPLRPWWGRP
jgi:hypothetical protein